MSLDFNCVKVVDPILQVSDKLNYAVECSGQNVNVQDFVATSASTSSMTWNVVIPNDVTVISRKVMVTATIILKLSINAAVDPTLFPVSYGQSDALGPFPLHQLISTNQISFNSSIVTTNVSELMPVFLRQNASDAFNVYNDLCPTMFDTALNYADAQGTIQNVLSGAQNTLMGLGLKGRGAHPVEFFTSTNGGTTLTPWAPFAAAGATPISDLYCRFTTTEPVFCSPLLWGQPTANLSGVYGINQMNVTFNIGNANRVWRKAYPKSGVTPVDGFNVSLFSIDRSSKLTFNFLTPKPTQYLPVIVATPYYNFSRYVSPGAAFNVNDSVTLTAQSLKLNQIPDRLFIYVRKSLATQNWYDSDFFLKINYVQIDWNNRSGLLSSADSSQLYRLSKEAFSNQSWEEFNGVTSVKVGSNSAADSNSGLKMPTSGSLLCLNMGSGVEIAEEFYSPGSLGNFNLQVKVNCTWQQTSTVIPTAIVLGTPIAARTYAVPPIQTELVIVTMDSGMLTCSRGTSNLYTGILTKEQVLDTIKKDTYNSQNSVQRMVGGDMNDRTKFFASNVMKHLDLPKLEKAKANLSKYLA